MQLQGQVAIVTGANQGIGKDIATAFAREGASVVLAARRLPELESVASAINADGGKAVAVQADVSKESDAAKLVETAVNHFGGLDVLVNNAGIAGPIAPITEIDAAAWRECIEINLTGPWLCSREAARVMKGKGGRIINIGSITGKRPLVNRTPYGASKLGVVGLTRALALELGPEHINVNCISPGAVNTSRLALIAENAGMPLEELLKLAAQGSALGTVSEGSDVAALCVFLASDAARQITGQDINVDAGAYMD
jgi:NAD(P)-dependent dehydrogenase (short-subunit alcohol dehydrogenase family)